MYEIKRGGHADMKRIYPMMEYDFKDWERPSLVECQMALLKGAELLLHLRREKERVHNIQPQRQVQKLGAVFHNSILRRVQHLVIDGGKIAVRTQRAALDHSKKCKFNSI